MDDSFQHIIDSFVVLYIFRVLLKKVLNRRLAVIELKLLISNNLFILADFVMYEDVVLDF